MSSYSSIYYFMIGNYNTHRPIGYYINSNINDNNFDNVKFTCDDIFQKFTEDSSKNKKNKLNLDYYIIFYTLKNSGTFYLAVVLKNSLYSKEENLIFELFEDIDHQGIKKLVNKDGVLTHVGEQNLKFCIEVYQENNRKKRKNSIDEIYNENDFKNKDTSKIALLNSEINDIQTNMKQSVKNMITNVNDIQDLDNKSSKIKDSSYQFQKDSAYLEKEVKYRKLLRKILIYSVLSIILIFLLYLIFK